MNACPSDGGGGTDRESPDVRNHTQEELDAICDEAHAQHHFCSIHCFTPDAHRMALKAGADTIGMSDAAASNRFKALLNDVDDLLTMKVKTWVQSQQLRSIFQS